MHCTCPLSGVNRTWLSASHPLLTQSGHAPVLCFEEWINHLPESIARCRELIAVAVSQIDGDPIVGDCLVDPALEITVAHLEKIIALQRAGRRNPMTHENAEDLTAHVLVGRSVRHRSTIRFARHRSYGRRATVDKIAQPLTRLLTEAPALLLLPAVALAGAFGGALFGAVAGVLRATRGVSEVISTILLNFVAASLVALAIHGPLQEASRAYPKSDPLPAAALLPSFGRVHAGLLVALLLAVLLYGLLFRTPFGFRMRAVGLAPTAARFAGIWPERLAVTTLALSGALAGIAGAIEVSGVTGQLYEGLSAGSGYTAIAVALLARLHPLGGDPSRASSSARWRRGAGGHAARGRRAGGGDPDRAGDRHPVGGWRLDPAPRGSPAGGPAAQRGGGLMEALLEAALRLAAPLLLAALGELVIERAGLIDVGIEGTMLTGAFAGFAVAVASGSALAGVAAAGAAGLGVGALFAAFAVVGRIDQIVVGTAVNLLALGATGAASRALYAGAPPSAPTLGPLAAGPLAELPWLGALLFAQTPLRVGRRAAGARGRAGAGPHAGRPAPARGGGVGARRGCRRRRGGARAHGRGADRIHAGGLAGAALSLAQSDSFTEGMTAGRGFIALAIVIFGRWSALGVLLASLFFGCATALQFPAAGQGNRDPVVLFFLMFPYLVTLAVLALATGRARAPADLGRAYAREASS